jgi:hypothetical protein
MEMMDLMAEYVDATPATAPNRMISMFITFTQRGRPLLKTKQF